MFQMMNKMLDKFSEYLAPGKVSSRSLGYFSLS